MENSTPITGREALEEHLQALLQDPEITLDAKLFDEVELQLNESNISPLVPRLLPPLTQTLTTYQKDPSVLASLTTKLLIPVSFTQVLTLASEESLIQALISPAPSVNILAITVIHKAARSPADTAILSSAWKSVLQNLLRTWLSTPHVEVGEKVTSALGDLLEVDCDRRSISTRMNGMDLTERRRMPPGQGLLWRRIFQDRESYEILLSLCSTKTLGEGDDAVESSIDERQKSLAQGRLLRLLPRLVPLDFLALSHSDFPDLESRYGSEAGAGRGLLWFAAADMVQKSEDMLMHITLMDFVAEFLEVLSVMDIAQADFDYLVLLLREVTRNDQPMMRSLESIAANPETLPEMLDLLHRLNQYQE